MGEIHRVKVGGQVQEWISVEVLHQPFDRSGAAQTVRAYVEGEMGLKVLDLLGVHSTSRESSDGRIVWTASARIK